MLLQKLGHSCNFESTAPLIFSAQIKLWLCLKSKDLENGPAHVFVFDSKSLCRCAAILLPHRGVSQTQARMRKLQELKRIAGREEDGVL